MNDDIMFNINVRCVWHGGHGCCVATIGYTLLTATCTGCSVRKYDKLLPE